MEAAKVISIFKALLLKGEDCERYRSASPWTGSGHAELILPGTCGGQTCGQQIKPIEFASRATKINGLEG